MAQSNFNHLMFDIETIGLTADSTVIAIALALFDPATGEVGTERCYLPPTDGQGGTVCFDTIKWWMKTNPELFSSYLSRHPGVGVPKDWEEIADEISALISLHNVDTIWCNGIDFDIPILAAAFERTTATNPLAAFSYKQRRDLRQWKFAAEQGGWEQPVRPTTSVRHEALSDVIWQCNVACNLWNFLSE
jgi:exodeoxyribonuclease VIII